LLSFAAGGEEHANHRRRAAPGVWVPSVGDRRGAALMGHGQYSRRDFLQQTVLAGGGALLLGSCTSGGKSSSGGLTPGGAKLPAVEGGVVVTDPAKMPKKLSESPAFARQVAAGKLPPVAERVGQDPLVIKPVHEIGTYGGELHRGYLGAADFQNPNRFCAGPDTLLYWDYTGKTLVPNLARGYELNKDGTVLTLHLRRGMKWSDGQPFTADDIIFWREDISLNKELAIGPSILTILGRPVKVEKVDDFTVRYTSQVPYPLLPAFLASTNEGSGLTSGGKLGGGTYAPKHYLSKFHPKYTSQAEADRVAKAAGFNNWPAFFHQQMDWTLNTKLPLLTPWVPTRPINDSPYELEASPYSIWVDTDGNQLPYIPKITMREVGNREVLNLQAVGGDYDFQDRSLAISSLPVLLKNQSRSKYTIHRNPSSIVDCTVRVNLAYDKDKTVGDLLRNVDFRRALSLGIDRDQINQTFFLGTCTPTAAIVNQDSPYFPGAQWRTKWATHDPAQANQLLDKIGLTAKDSAGYRMRPDGKGRIRLEYTSNADFVDFPAIGEMIKRQWKSIGIDMTSEVVQTGLLIQRILGNQIMLQGIPSASDNVLLNPAAVLPTPGNAGTMGIPYATWFTSNGKAGVEPPESLKLLKDGMEHYRRAIIAPEPQRTNLAKQIYVLHADQVWSIGVVGFGLTVYGLYCAKNNLGNVPARINNNTTQRTANNTLPMTFYFK
jgi:peptide/nickel transport system substrate-binding protein